MIASTEIKPPNSPVLAGLFHLHDERDLYEQNGKDAETLREMDRIL